jgi:hypothetical protein
VEYPRETIRKFHSEEIDQELEEADWGYFINRVEKKGTVF